MTCKDRILQLSQIMTIAGCETQSTDRLRALFSGQFDEIRTDAAGNHLFFRRSGRTDAKLLLLDAHYDEIGMMVSECLTGGFVRFVAIGGVDAKVLPASEVVLYGKELLHGVVVSTPPHLQNPKEEGKSLPIAELLIDTGCTKEELLAIAPPGTPIGFVPGATFLANDCICAKGMDDKVLAAAALTAAAEADLSYGWDVCVSLSAKEETGCLGARCAANALHPAAAIALDVEFARLPNTPTAETTCRFGGATIALSAVTDRALTRALLDTAKAAEIPHQKIVWASNTGTNANYIGLSRRGVPCALCGVPILNMHTAVETVALSDVEAVTDLLIAMLEGGLAQWDTIRNNSNF